VVELLSEKLREREASAKADSERLMRALCWLVDVWSEGYKKDVFLEKAFGLLSASKNMLWRGHWLKLRRHILEKLESIEDEPTG